MAGLTLSVARTNPEGFQELADLYLRATLSRELAIQVDCSGMSWCDANLAAAIQALRYRLRVEQGKVLHLVKIPTMPLQALTAVGLLPTSRPRKRDTIIPLRRFELGDGKEFASYTFEHFSNKGLPIMSDAVTQRFYEGIDELFQNCAIHSKSDLGVFASGQLFPRKDRLDFSMVDLGLGIPHVVRSHAGGHLSSPAAINWAMTGTNTTRMGDVPGGLGLKILREFIRQNGGRLVIASYDGYWAETKDAVLRRTLSSPFPGTVVTIEVDTSDESQYIMSDEIDPGAVF